MIGADLSPRKRQIGGNCYNFPHQYFKASPFLPGHSLKGQENEKDQSSWKIKWKPTAQWAIEKGFNKNWVSRQNIMIMIFQDLLQTHLLTQLIDFQSWIFHQLEKFTFGSLSFKYFPWSIYLQNISRFLHLPKYLQRVSISWNINPYQVSFRERICVKFQYFSICFVFCCFGQKPNIYKQ